MSGVKYVGVTAVALVALLGACASPPQTPALPSAGTSTPSGYTWKPKQPLPAVTMSAAEREKLTQQRLQQFAKIWKISDPPQVAVVRWIYPEEVGTVHVACLREAGYKAESTGDGRGLSADFGSLSQQGAFNLARYRCNAMYPIDPRTDSSRLTDAQRSVVYEYIVESLVPCLERIGANPADPPTLAVFLANATSWEYPDPGSADKQDSWLRECPIDPPSGALLGEG